MLVARRDFLRLLGIATAVGAIDPSALARTTGDRYFNDRLALSMTKPAGWTFLSVVDYQAASEHHLVNIDNPEIEEILRNPDSMPFLAITKCDGHYSELTPCITAWDEPVEPHAGDELEYHHEAIGAWKRFLPEVVLHTEPSYITLSCGTRGTRSVWSFLLQHDSGHEWNVNVRTILVFRADHTHTFHFMDGQQPPAVASTELERAARSLAYGAA